MSVEIADWVVWLSSVVGAVGLLWAALRKKVRRAIDVSKVAITQIQKAVLTLNGRPAITKPETGEEVEPPLPGALERFDRIESRQDRALVHLAKMSLQVKTIEHEVQHNGGGSIKDAVKRIEDRLEEGNDRFEKIEHSFATLADAQSDMWRAIEAVAKSSPPEEEAI